jgi:hypothetical protein
VLVRLGVDDSETWAAAEVVRRWLTAYPSKTAKGVDIEINQAWIHQQAKDEKRVEVPRERLANSGSFMHALKEPPARMANKEDEYKGMHAFESRAFTGAETPRQFSADWRVATRIRVSAGV